MLHGALEVRLRDRLRVRIDDDDPGGTVPQQTHISLRRTVSAMEDHPDDVTLQAASLTSMMTMMGFQEGAPGCGLPMSGSGHHRGCNIGDAGVSPSPDQHNDEACAGRIQESRT